MPRTFQSTAKVVAFSEEEIPKRNSSSVYILKKFDNEIFPLLNESIKQETSTQKKYWTREYTSRDISFYNQRKNKI
jgi:hypothetical protein